MNKQTAVDFLVSILNKDGFAPVLTDEEIQIAKQMEKQQIVNAVDGFPLYTRDLLGDDYYNELYVETKNKSNV